MTQSKTLRSLFAHWKWKETLPAGGNGEQGIKNQHTLQCPILVACLFIQTFDYHENQLLLAKAPTEGDQQQQHYHHAYMEGWVTSRPWTTHEAERGERPVMHRGDGRGPDLQCAAHHVCVCE